MRDADFGDDAGAFGEPGWDIMLDLFRWRAARKRISLSSSHIEAQVSTTTAARKVRELERRGLVRREGDEEEGRRWWLWLTPRGARLPDPDRRAGVALVAGGSGTTRAASLPPEQRMPTAGQCPAPPRPRRPMQAGSTPEDVGKVSSERQGV